MNKNSMRSHFYTVVLFEQLFVKRRSERFMMGNVISNISTDSVEAVKMAIDTMKMQGETVLKLIEDQKQLTQRVSNPEGVGKTVDVYV